MQGVEFEVNWVICQQKGRWITVSLKFFRPLAVLLSMAILVWLSRHCFWSFVLLSIPILWVPNARWIMTPRREVIFGRMRKHRHASLLVCKFYCQEFASGGRQWMKFNVIQLFSVRTSQISDLIDGLWMSWSMSQPWSRLYCWTCSHTSLHTKRRPNTQWASLRTRRWFHWTWTYILQRVLTNVPCQTCNRCIIAGLSSFR